MTLKSLHEEYQKLREKETRYFTKNDLHRMGLLSCFFHAEFRNPKEFYALIEKITGENES